MNNARAVKFLEDLGHLDTHLTGAANAHIIVIDRPENIPQGRVEFLLDNYSLIIQVKYLMNFSGAFDKFVGGLYSSDNSSLDYICVIYLDDHSA